MNLTFKRISLPLMAGAAFVVSMAGAQSASAQTSFATFTQTNTNSIPFTFTNSGSSSTLTASTNVVWNWLTPSASTTVGTPISATMTFVAQVAGQTSTSNSLPLVSQRLNITDLIFTDNANGKVLLDLDTPQASSLIAMKGATTASMSATHATYSSDFLTFGAPANGKLTLTLAAISPHVGVSSNGYLKSFMSSGTGTFSNATRPVPEVGTMMSMGMMVTGGGMFGIRRRKRQASQTVSAPLAA